MDHAWQPTAEELVKLREAILKEQPELATNEPALSAVVQRAIEFARKWEPHVLSGGESLTEPAG